MNPNDLDDFYSNRYRQCIQVAEKNLFPVEIQHIRAFELVEHRSHHLTARASEVGDILVRHIVFHQSFKTYLPPLFGAHLVQIFHDSAF